MKTTSLFAALSLSLLACGGAEGEANEPQPANDQAVQEAPAETPEAPATADIVDTAVAAGSFTTLVKAVQAAELVDALKGEGPFTVFAPTDEAFAKLPPGTIDALLADKEKLKAVLTYHVVAGKVTAADVVNLSEAKTLQGGTLSIDASNGVKIGNATVIKADIMTSNGVIHVIDTVLIPE